MGTTVFVGGRQIDPVTAISQIDEELASVSRQYRAYIASGREGVLTPVQCLRRLDELLDQRLIAMRKKAAAP